MEQFQIPANQPLPEFTDFGGYDIYYMDDEGAVLCGPCAQQERDDEGLKVTGFIHWEGPPEHCAGCSKELPSQYGDPDAPEGEVH